jgi:type II secretory pathway pseudopilin PulG
MELLIVIVVVVAVALVARSASRNRQQRQALEERRGADLEAVRKVTDEDVTRFGEELQRLDTDLLTDTLDEPTRQDYQRALDSYESAKESLARVTRSEDVRHVTETLEDGRYAVACVRARVSGQPLPVRRPPCFFNPAHGPSTTDIEWAPPGGQQRQIPVCAADADRVSQGAEPDVRTVPQGVGRVPYWQGGPAYSPWASGYFGGYAASGLLPAFMLMTLLSPSWDGGGADAFDDGDDGSGGGDGGDSGDGGGDGGDSGDSGYDGGDSGDGGYDGGDSGGDWGGDGGGFDFGGGGDFGGGDFGGGDFGGGDFGGF